MNFVEEEFFESAQADGKAGDTVALKGDAPAGPAIEVPDALEMGREAKRQGLPMEIPATLQGEALAPQREAFQSGYESEGAAA